MPGGVGPPHGASQPERSATARRSFGTASAGVRGSEDVSRGYWAVSRRSARRRSRRAGRLTRGDPDQGGEQTMVKDEQRQAVTARPAGPRQEPPTHPSGRDQERGRQQPPASRRGPIVGTIAIGPRSGREYTPVASTRGGGRIGPSGCAVHAGSGKRADRRSRGGEQASRAAVRASALCHQMPHGFGWRGAAGSPTATKRRPCSARSGWKSRPLGSRNQVIVNIHCRPGLPAKR